MDKIATIDQVQATSKKLNAKYARAFQMLSDVKSASSDKEIQRTSGCLPSISKKEKHLED